MVRQYDRMPYVVVEAAVDTGLGALAGLPGVARVHHQVAYRPMDAESFPLIGQPAAVSAGATGAGTAVAVLDTGADWTHADLGACSAPGPDCRVVRALDLTDFDDGRKDDERRHGTNVASIVAGMAPGADIVAIDIFPEGERGAPDEIILAGLDWVATNHAAFGIVAVNMSVGGSNYPGFCPNATLAAGVGAVRATGISVVAAAGNDTSKGGLSSPGCIPGVLSVGNVYDSDVGTKAWSYCADISTEPDQLACTSNSSPALALLAPGGAITAGGVTMFGTSQAAPHVAGAVALLRGEIPDEPLDLLESRLTVSGPRLVDARNGLPFHRIDVPAALAAKPDEEAPTGTVALQGGQAWVAPGTSISVGLDAEDRSGVTTMCVSATDSCENWVPYTPGMNWKVPAGVETFSLNAWFSDRWGHVSGPFSDDLGIDGVPPVEGATRVEAVGRNAVFTWSPGTDDRSGVKGFLIVEGDSKVPPPGCLYAVMRLWGDASDGRAVIEDLEPGSRHYYRLCVSDGANNEGQGVPLVVDIDPNAKADDAGGGSDDAGAANGCGCDGISGGIAALAALAVRRRRRA